MQPDHDIKPPPPPSRWLYTLVIFMTLAVIAAFLAVIYGLAVTVRQL